MTAARLLLLLAAGCGRSNLFLYPPDEGSGGSFAAGGLGGGGASPIARGGTTGVSGNPPVARGGTPEVGNGGTSAVGSGGASSGGATSGGSKACGELIDDMEDATGRICTGAGRVGVWYAFNDDTGTQWPQKTAPGVPIQTSLLPAPRGTSRRGMHTYGPGFTGWGGGVGFDLSFDGSTYRLYDASRYSGLRFWLRGAPDTSVGFRLSTQSTTAAQWGGTCASDCGGPGPLELALGPEWIEYVVPFSELGRLSPNEFDRLTNVQFKIQRLAFDYWVDDISFTVGPSNCCSPLPTCASGAQFRSSALRSLVGGGDPNTPTLDCNAVCSARSLVGTQQTIEHLAGVECLSQLNRISLTESGLLDVTALSGRVALASVELSGNALRDVTPLSGLTNLAHLDLGTNQVSDLSPLAGLASLRRLLLSENAISDVTPLQSLSDLRKLLLANNKVSKLAPLAKLIHLTELDLSGNAVIDVSPLASLSSLLTLDLSENSVEQGSPLAALTALTNLDLSYNRLTSLEPLSGMTKLWWLNLSNNSISSLGKPHDLPSLLSLFLNENLVTDVAPLAVLSTLVNIDLSKNQVQNIDALRALPALYGLYMADNFVTRLGPAFHPAGLRDLDLSNNGLLEVVSLSGMTFRNLILKNNPLSDLSGFSDARFENVPCGDRCGSSPGLLDLSNTQLVDLSPLLGTTMPAGFRVDLRGNDPPLDCTSQAATLQALRAQGVTVSTDCP